MSVVKCTTCFNTVSNATGSCSSCGAKVPKQTVPVAWLALAFIVFAVIGTHINNANMSPEEKAAKAEAAQAEAAEKAALEEKQKEQNWIYVGQDAVRAMLKDGDSAKFRNDYFSRGKDGIPVACGEVNSKNGFGAYGGFQRYISAGKPELTFLEEQAGDFNVAWVKFCQ